MSLVTECLILTSDTLKGDHHDASSKKGSDQPAGAKTI